MLCIAVGRFPVKLPVGMLNNPTPLPYMLLNTALLPETFPVALTALAIVSVFDVLLKVKPGCAPKLPVSLNNT